ncbi:MAG: methylated-DNA-protein-cysteine methyltransferase related protein [Bacteroidetes bacterium]|nr:MAG: methylated-DNA-protein-cysteine methyltransferase related protein [Bacteroidota bacterium]
MKSRIDTDFFYMVYEVVRLVPYGRVTTYGAIANYLGTKGSSRMVGWAMNSSHSHHSPVPAHRVVNREGLLTGKNHFHTPMMMQELLENEGVRVKNDKVINFKQLFWDPNLELKM